MSSAATVPPSVRPMPAIEAAPASRHGRDRNLPPGRPLRAQIVYDLRRWQIFASSPAVRIHGALRARRGLANVHQISRACCHTESV